MTRVRGSRKIYGIIRCDKQQFEERQTSGEDYIN